VKTLILIIVVLSSACGSFAQAVLPPVYPSAGPILPQRPHLGLGRVASAQCTGDHEEFCLSGLHGAVSCDGVPYAFACPVRGTPAIGVGGMVPVPVVGMGSRTTLACEQLPYADEIGFKGVRKGSSVSIAFVRLDESSGQYVVGQTCSYTLFGNRNMNALSGARCTGD
jgi:hypothetical protein